MPRCPCVLGRFVGKVPQALRLQGGTGDVCRKTILITGGLAHWRAGWRPESGRVTRRVCCFLTLPTPNAEQPH